MDSAGSEPSLSSGFSAGYAAVRCADAQRKSVHRRNLKQRRTVTTTRALRIVLLDRVCAQQAAGDVSPRSHSSHCQPGAGCNNEHSAWMSARRTYRPFTAGLLYGTQRVPDSVSESWVMNGKSLKKTPWLLVGQLDGDGVSLIADLYRGAFK